MANALMQVFEYSLYMPALVHLQEQGHVPWPCPLLQTRAREHDPVPASLIEQACIGNTQLLELVHVPWSRSGPRPTYY